MSFLQSKQWEKFQQSLGRKTYRTKSGELLIKMPLAFGKSYLYLPRPQHVGDRIPYIQCRGSDPLHLEDIVFLRIDPEWEDTEENRKKLRDADFKKSPKEVQPKKTLILDLKKSEEELLADMKQKTRYNIRLASRQGAEIRNPKSEIRNKSQIPNSNPQTLFIKFWHMLQNTADRGGFRTHKKEYYEKMLAQDFNELHWVEHGGKMIAAAVVNFFEGRATYLHGASDYKFRKYMAPYLLHWEIIKYAKNNGFQEYDLWGIDEKKWPGMTRFKRGFGGHAYRQAGREVEYVGAYDYVLQNFWYLLYKLRQYVKDVMIKTLNRKRRLSINV